MRRITLLAAVALLDALPAAAQTVDQHAAYRAMIYTPIAGLPPLPPNMEPLGRSTASRTTLQGRVGHMSRDGGLSINTVGLGVELPVQRWQLGGTFAYLSTSCGAEWDGDSDCSSDIMLGASARRTLTSKSLGQRPTKARRAKQSNDGTLVVGFEGSAGFAPHQGEQAMAVAVGLPTGIALQNGDVRIMPFVTPGLGYGRMGHTEYDDVARSYGAFSFLVGGGLTLQFDRSGLGASLGFQKVLQGQGSATQLGISMSWQGLASR